MRRKGPRRNRGEYRARASSSHGTRENARHKDVAAHGHAIPLFAPLRPLWNCRTIPHHGPDDSSSATEPQTVGSTMPANRLQEHLPDPRGTVEMAENTGGHLAVQGNGKRRRINEDKC